MPSAQVTISQLPAAGAITGAELVPIVQNGLTVQTTTGAIAASPSQTQTFITLNQQPTLPNSRYLAGNSGVTLVDGGAQNPLTIELTGTALSLQNASSGLLFKVAGAVVPRTLVSGSSGISVANGLGVAGNPTVSLSGRVLNFQNYGGSSGLVAFTSSSIVAVDILGTANQIDVANGAGPGNPTISISSDPVIPGNGAITIPTGTTAQQPIGADGQIRYNIDSAAYEAYSSGSWNPFLQFSGVGITGQVLTSTGTGTPVWSGISGGTF